MVQWSICPVLASRLWVETCTYRDVVDDGCQQPGSLEQSYVLIPKSALDNAVQAGNQLFRYAVPLKFRGLICSCCITYTYPNISAIQRKSHLRPQNRDWKESTGARPHSSQLPSSRPDPGWACYSKWPFSRSPNRLANTGNVFLI